MDSIVNFFKDNLVLTGAGASAIIFMLTRIIPNSWLYSTAYHVTDKIFLFLYDGIGIPIKAFGKTISLGGRSKMGVKFWEKIEDWIENSINNVINGIMNAWDKRRKNTCVLIHWWTMLQSGWNYDNNKK